MEHLRDSELKKDLQASVRTAQELGPDYESEIIDGFLQRLDARLDAQVATRVQRELDRREGPVQFQKKSGDGGGAGGGRNPAIPILSIVLAVPLTAISASLAGLPGLFVVWVGIVLVNMAVSLGTAAGNRAERRRQQFGDLRDGRGRDGWS
jgi:hypothetical protein